MPQRALGPHHGSCTAIETPVGRAAELLGVADVLLVEVLLADAESEPRVGTADTVAAAESVGPLLCCDVAEAVALMLGHVVIDDVAEAVACNERAASSDTAAGTVWSAVLDAELLDTAELVARGLVPTVDVAVAVDVAVPVDDGVAGDVREGDAVALGDRETRGERDDEAVTLALTVLLGERDEALVTLVLAVEVGEVVLDRDTTGVFELDGLFDDVREAATDAVDDAEGVCATERRADEVALGDGVNAPLSDARLDACADVVCSGVNVAAPDALDDDDAERVVVEDDEADGEAIADALRTAESATAAVREGGGDSLPGALSVGSAVTVEAYDALTVPV